MKRQAILSSVLFVAAISLNAEALPVFDPAASGTDLSNVNHQLPDITLSSMHANAAIDTRHENTSRPVRTDAGPITGAGGRVLTLEVQSADSDEAAANDGSAALLRDEEAGAVDSQVDASALTIATFAVTTSETTTDTTTSGLGVVSSALNGDPVTVAPEPSTFVLMGMTCVAFGLGMRRRKRSDNAMM